MSHISNGGFLEKNESLHKFIHFPKGIDFEVRLGDLISGEYKNLIDQFRDITTDYYNKRVASLIYLNFIMGEKYRSVDEIQSSIWPEGKNSGVFKIVAKLGYDKGWPLFPKKLNVSSLPYKFE